MQNVTNVRLSVYRPWSCVSCVATTFILVRGQSPLDRKECPDTINRASEYRGDTVYITEGQVVHEHSRCAYTNRHNITSHLKKRPDENVGNVSQTLRSQSEPFEFS